MSNPTTPFSWQMPQNTDLVTDLPADFEVFGQAVATSMQDLLGGTTGQVLKKNTNADMDFVWSADAAGMTNPMTTTGDVIYSSPGSTPVRLGIGSAGQVMTVASGIPSWATPSAGAGDLAQIATGSLTGTSISLTGLSSYSELILVLYSVGYTTGNSQILFRVNGNTTSNYARIGWVAYNSSNSSQFSLTDSTFRFNGNANSIYDNNSNTYTAKFTNCKTTGFTDMESNSAYDSSAGERGVEYYRGVYKVSEAVSSLSVFISNGYTFNNGNYILWGA